MRHNAGNGVWSWIKSKISTFISSVGGNSVVWNDGIYFNFYSAINAIKNIAGGVVGQDAYEQDMDLINNSINVNIPAQIASAVTEAKNYTDSEFTATKVYDKKLPTNVVLPATPADTPAVNTKLIDIIGSIYSWIRIIRGYTYDSGNWNTMTADAEFYQNITPLDFKIYNNAMYVKVKFFQFTESCVLSSSVALTTIILGFLPSEVAAKFTSNQNNILPPDSQFPFFNGGYNKYYSIIRTLKTFVAEMERTTGDVSRSGLYNNISVNLLIEYIRSTPNTVTPTGRVLVGACCANANNFNGTVGTAVIQGNDVASFILTDEVFTINLLGLIN
jgi:hypothetical protein